jgi:aspartate racemase
MKTIGLLGGMSWESSIEYYRLINEAARAELGGLHSARSLMYSVDFAEIETLQHAGQWDEAADFMVDAARRVEKGGADFLLICTNTMHRMADAVQAQIDIPLLHIADATAVAIQEEQIERVGLLGTRFTMEEDFYKGRLAARGLDVLIPPVEAREQVHQIIYNELVVGEIKTRSQAIYIAVMDNLRAAGAEGIILGCTEIGLLVGEADAPIPVFDTTQIHAQTAVAYALDQVSLP